MTNQTKTTRIAPGYYEVTDGQNTVEIYRNEMLDYEYGQWVVSMPSRPSRCTDPIVYLKDAKEAARQMLETADDF